MVGRTVSHFRITAEVGQGGMGVVYRAEDTLLKRTVALKFLRPEWTADPRAKQRLLQEARMASRLSHPNIATVFEVGEAEEATFIAMEFVSGESLSHALLRGPYPTGDLPDLARSIAEGLDAAHRGGVLHRDVKPANVIIDETGGLKILDFGLAVLCRRERAPGESSLEFTTRTADGFSTAGTIPYMSPEQLQGRSPDARSDIFSFGALVYECIAGRLPFSGKSAIDVMHAICNQRATPLCDVVADVAPAWERLVERCLEKAPEQRFQTMRDVLDALPRGPAREVHRQESVAVLYFENLGEVSDDAQLRDGMTEDIITELAKIRHLRVFPRSAVVVYRDQPVTAPQVGAELDARYVLEGSLRRSHNRLRVTVQLAETRTGHSVWAERYDRQLEDVFAIQDEIALSVARALRSVLPTSETPAAVRAPTVDVKAYEYYLSGRQLFFQWRRHGFEYAERMFRRAIQIDPSFARAHAGVADCLSLLYHYWDARDALLDQAETASAKALELEPERAEPHSSRGLVLSLRKRFDEARREFEAAIRLNPNLFEALYFYGRACLAQGNVARAASLFKQAAALRPEDYQSSNQLAGCYTSMGRRAEATEAYRRVVTAAERQLEQHPEDGRALYMGACALGALGESDRGLRWAERALVLNPDEPVTLYNVGCFYVLQGDTDRAVDCLQHAVEQGFTHREWIEHDPDLNPLRDHPRFRALLESMRSAVPCGEVARG